MALSGKRLSAPGMDDISYKMISNLPNKAKNNLLNMYNKCLTGEPLPESWKKYNIITILKHNKNPSNAENYRPIVLSSVYCKTLEIMIKNRLDYIMENKQHFTFFQAGFRKGMGINNNIALLTSHINLAFCRENSMIAVFLDIKSAYDGVNIYTLYNKLTSLDIPKELTNLIFKILENRQLFSRKTDGSFMGPINTTTGLPQGSPLSTVLFNTYLLDLFKLPMPEEVNLIGYADDLVLYCKGKNTQTITQKINNTMKKINIWLKKITFPSLLKNANAYGLLRDDVRKFLRI